MAYPKIVFHHIPKCGGTSLVRGLALSYYPLRVLLKGRAGFPGALDVRAAARACEITGSPARQFRVSLLAYQLARSGGPFVSGHYPFSPAVYDHNKNDWTFITVLRDPVSRWYSEYFYNRFKTAGEGRTELDIGDYLDDTAGKAAAYSFVNFLVEREGPALPPSTNDVAAALEALSCFDVVGCLENLDGFRNAMKKRFGRRPFFPHVNKNPVKTEAQPRPDEDSEFHRTLLERLAADIEIYEQAKRRNDGS